MDAEPTQQKSLALVGTVCSHACVGWEKFRRVATVRTCLESPGYAYGVLPAAQTPHQTTADAESWGIQPACAGIVKNPEDNPACSRAHVWARRLSRESTECVIPVVRAHCPEPSKLDKEAWPWWLRRGNFLADEFGKCGAELHPEPVVAGIPAIQAAAHLQAMLAIGDRCNYGSPTEIPEGGPHLQCTKRRRDSFKTPNRGSWVALDWFDDVIQNTVEQVPDLHLLGQVEKRGRKLLTVGSSLHDAILLVKAQAFQSSHIIACYYVLGAEQNIIGGFFMCTSCGNDAANRVGALKHQCADVSTL
eukprot:313649-Amphidinium_carterae.1